MAPQGARPKVNQPTTSQVVVQFLEVISEFTKDLQGGEEVEDIELIELVKETVKESPEQLP